MYKLETRVKSEGGSVKETWGLQVSVCVDLTRSGTMTMFFWRREVSFTRASSREFVQALLRGYRVYYEAIEFTMGLSKIAS